MISKNSVEMVSSNNDKNAGVSEVSNLDTHWNFQQVLAESI
jgi:hypothetical protein